MFKKQFRLTSREFDAFYKSGKRYHSPTLQIIHAPHDELRVSVVVPKKVAPRAFMRNRERRRLYHQIKQTLPDNQTGVFICIAKPPYKDSKMEEVVSELRELVGRITKSR